METWFTSGLAVGLTIAAAVLAIFVLPLVVGIRSSRWLWVLLCPMAIVIASIAGTALGHQAAALLYPESYMPDSIVILFGILLGSPISIVVAAIGVIDGRQDRSPVFQPALVPGAAGVTQGPIEARDGQPVINQRCPNCGGELLPAEDVNRPSNRGLVCPDCSFSWPLRETIGVAGNRPDTLAASVVVPVNSGGLGRRLLVVGVLVALKILADLFVFAGDDLAPALLVAFLFGLVGGAVAPRMHLGLWGLLAPATLIVAAGASQSGWEEWGGVFGWIGAVMAVVVLAQVEVVLVLGGAWIGRFLRA